MHGDDHNPDDLHQFGSATFTVYLVNVSLVKLDWKDVKLGFLAVDDNNKCFSYIFLFPKGRYMEDKTHIEGKIKTWGTKDSTNVRVHT